MVNKGMNLEQIQAENFFNRLWEKSVSKAVSWLLIGVLSFGGLGICMVPAQNVLAEDGWLMPAILVMLTYLMLSFRSRLYDQYNENQKSRFMADILKYHPINRKEIWKYKTKKLVTFLAKVSGVGLVLQIVVALIAYQTISWLNFFYIIFYMFICPMTGQLIMDSILKKVGE